LTSTLNKLYIEEEDITVKAMIWDTSGSERYRAITVGHYRDALGAILVFDVTDLSSFHNLDYWLEELRKHVSPRCVIVLMPNKVDLVDDSGDKRQVFDDQIKDYARVNDLVYLGECSAKNDINVMTTLDYLIKQIYAHNSKILTRDTINMRTSAHLESGGLM
jgi:small GTP-binding protein